MNIQIYDNGGRTIDRYCVIVDEQRVYAMTADPLKPGGVRYLCDSVDLDRREAGRPLPIEQVPKNVLSLIATNRNAWLKKRRVSA